MRGILFLAACALIWGGSAFAATADSLFIYPDYPEIVTPDTDYTITVSQGGRSEDLMVYSMCRQTGAEVLDNYRRFAEFAFEGEVHIRISSDIFDLSTAQVMPKEAAAKTTYSGGELMITLDQSRNIVVNVNKDYRTTLGIFAEAPERDIPNKDDPDVLYYEAGYHTTTEVMKLKAGQTLYLEPGAILDANIRADGDGITIIGRGIIRDRLFGEAATLTPVVRMNDNVKNVTIKDLKFLDSKTFVLVGNARNSNVLIDNVKILSNRSNSDGISFWNSPQSITVRNSYIFIADNALIFHGKCENLVYEDCIIGTTVALVASAKDVVGSVHIRNIDVFAVNIARGYNTAMVTNNAYAGDVEEGRSYVVDGLVFENIDAGYCKNIHQLFSGNGVTGDAKKFVFKNVIVPGNVATGVRVMSGGGYEFIMEDVWFGSQLISSDEKLKINNKGDTTVVYSHKNTDVRIFLHEYVLRFEPQPVVRGGQVLVPWQGISLSLGARCVPDEAAQSVSVTVGQKTVVINAENGAQMIEGKLFIPLAFACEAFGAETNYDAQTNTLTISGNAFFPYTDTDVVNPVPHGTELLDNCNFESELRDGGLYGYSWEAHNDSKITRITDSDTAQNGDNYLKVSERKHGYSGVRQMVTPQLQANGPGKYKFSMYVRAAAPNPVGENEQFHMTLTLRTDEMTEDKTYSSFFVITSQWQRIELEATIRWEGDLYLARLSTVGTKTHTYDFYMDQCSMTKVREHFVLDNTTKNIKAFAPSHTDVLHTSIILGAYKNGELSDVVVTNETYITSETVKNVSIARLYGKEFDYIKCVLWRAESQQPLWPVEIIERLELE